MAEKILILGAGAIGAFYGALLANQGTCELFDRAGIEW